MSYRNLLLISIFACISLLTQSTFVKGFPDALRCGDGNTPGAIYFLHGGA